MKTIMGKINMVSSVVFNKNFNLASLEFADELNNPPYIVLPVILPIRIFDFVYMFYLVYLDNCYKKF